VRTENLALREERHLFLNFELAGQPYFMSSPILSQLGEGHIRLSLPAVIYQAERRDRVRRKAKKQRVQVATLDANNFHGSLADVSPDGLAIDVPVDVDLERGSWVQLFATASTRAQPWDGDFAEVRHVCPSERVGFKRIGLLRTRQKSSGYVRVEHAVFPASASQATPVSKTPILQREVPLITFRNELGEVIAAILDSYGDPHRATAIVIPPAWGRTKETLLPLAATILETFRSINEPVLVIRFDGIRKRGESHLDPDIRQPGRENLRFTFSQGVRDVHSTLDFLHRSGLSPERTILVTFSVSSIEGRRVMAEAADRVSGWISVVGSADAQSLTRVISGGVDFFGGAERGVRFGYQEIQGMLVDMDLATRDALENRLAFLDDSRSDFARIAAPITWIHGIYDAWMDLDRAKHALSFGPCENRKVVLVPTGHQLRTSEEAMATFGLIAQEAVQMALDRHVVPWYPDPFSVAARSRAERERIERPIVDLHRFWRDYLVGRSAGAGIALVANTSPYRSLMKTQVEALDLDRVRSVVDLGCGIGTFAAYVIERSRIVPIRVVSMDYVREALISGRDQCTRVPPDSGTQLLWVQGSLDLASSAISLPLGTGTQDAALLSLVINYVPSPRLLLREVHRVLKPGGRLVLSSLKRDADISGICVDAVSELRRGRGREVLGSEGEKRLEEALKTFISDASRLLDLEEAGLFHFWSESELIAMVEAAGFRIERRDKGLGSSPQAHVVAAGR
jgi:SAM-dependent methyltransferase/pimeloyl-ACP methyl ester carboxylesterase